MAGIGRMLVFFGLLLVGLGVLLTLSDKVPWLGRLPGDIYVKRDNFTFYFPVTTCILLSVGLTLLLYIFRR